MAFWNVEPHEEAINIRRGDTWDMSFRVSLNDVDNTGDAQYYYDMTGMTLDITVKDRSGNIIKELSSAGTSPEITISTSIFNINTSGFDLAGEYYYDVQLTDGSDIFTIASDIISVTQDKTA